MYTRVYISNQEERSSRIVMPPSVSAWISNPSLSTNPPVYSASTPGAGCRFECLFLGRPIKLPLCVCFIYVCWLYTGYYHLVVLCSIPRPDSEALFQQEQTITCINICHSNGNLMMDRGYLAETLYR